MKIHSKYTHLVNILTYKEGGTHAFPTLYHPNKTPYALT